MSLGPPPRHSTKPPRERKLQLLLLPLVAQRRGVMLLLLLLTGKKCPAPRRRRQCPHHRLPLRRLCHLLEDSMSGGNVVVGSSSPLPPPHDPPLSPTRRRRPLHPRDPSRPAPEEQEWPRHLRRLWALAPPRWEVLPKILGAEQELQEELQLVRHRCRGWQPRPRWTRRPCSAMGSRSGIRHVSEPPYSSVRAAGSEDSASSVRGSSWAREPCSKTSSASRDGRRCSGLSAR